MTDDTKDYDWVEHKGPTITLTAEYIKQEAEALGMTEDEYIEYVEKSMQSVGVL